MDAAALDWIADALIGTVEAGAQSPAAMTFLLRRYAACGRDDIRAAVEVGLTRALEAADAEHDPRRRCEWLGVFAQAATLSDDERLEQRVRTALRSTIDDLESFARRAYEPGEGLLGARLDDQLQSASAFLTAFDLTARLPYSMLAEELLQAARRTGWDDDRGAFRGDFAVNASATHVLCRLEALHRDPEYTSSAVIATGSSYVDDARRILHRLGPIAREHTADAAEYGVALLDWFALNDHPN
jgi:hypothetical protein